MRGVRLPKRDLREIIDLYRWGARVKDLEDLYGYTAQTMRMHMKMHGVKMRVGCAPPLATPKPHKRAKETHAERPHSMSWKVKSIRPRIPDGVRVVDESQAPDRLLRSSARVQRDRRIEERRLGASIGSCPEAASVYRYASLRIGNRLPDLE